MVLWVGLSLLLLTQTGTPSAGAEFFSATCFPTLAEHKGVATSDLSLVSPGHKVLCNGNQTGFWTYNTRLFPRNRACLDSSCYEAPNHVAVTWLPDGGLSQYNISFEGMWTKFAPGLTVRAAFLSLGRCFVMSGLPNRLDLKGFGGNMSSFEAGKFHSFFIEVTTSYTKVSMDGRLAFQDGGVGKSNYLGNRVCQPFSHYSTGAMFGCMVSANGRALFSRVEGQVRNVRLEAEIPDAVKMTTRLV